MLLDLKHSLLQLDIRGLRIEGIELHSDILVLDGDDFRVDFALRKFDFSNSFIYGFIFFADTEILLEIFI